MNEKLVRTLTPEEVSRRVDKGLLTMYRNARLLSDLAERGAISRESFRSDTLQEHAIAQIIGQIGEGARRILEVTDETFGLPLRDIRSTRNFVTHLYESVNWETIAIAAFEEVPAMMGALEEAISSRGLVPEVEAVRLAGPAGKPEVIVAPDHGEVPEELPELRLADAIAEASEEDRS